MVVGQKVSKSKFTQICDPGPQNHIETKVVLIMFLAMHITNQKLRFDIVMVRNVQNISMEHDLYLIS